jgi:hypothetical protein
MPLFFCAFFLCPYASAAVNSLDTNIEFDQHTMSVELQKVPLKLLLEKLESERGIWHKGDADVLKEKISMSFENLSLDVALKRLLSRFDYVLLFGQKKEVVGVIIFGEKHSGIVYSRNASKNLGQAFRLGDSEKTTPETIDSFKAFIEKFSSGDSKGKPKNPFPEHLFSDLSRSNAGKENPFSGIEKLFTRGANDSFANPFQESLLTDNPFQDLPIQPTLNPFTGNNSSKEQNPFSQTTSPSQEMPFEAEPFPAPGSK